MIITTTAARQALYKFATSKNWDVDTSLDCVSEATEENGAYRMSLAFEDGSESLEFIVGVNGSIAEYTEGKVEAVHTHGLWKDNSHYKDCIFFPA